MGGIKKTDTSGVVEFLMRCPVNAGLNCIMSKDAFLRACARFRSDKRIQSVVPKKKINPCTKCEIKEAILANKEFEPPKGLQFDNLEPVNSMEDLTKQKEKPAIIDARPTR